ncbi:MAG: TIGR03768 family metallophosphoesterase [Nitrospirae bacterium]|nr:TIGR03768 family metallophosphoesterase [Nitrospirota bacterium]
MPYTQRPDLTPGYSGAPHAAHLLSFFAMTDVHISDKESPAQALYLGWSAPYGSGQLSSAYSPILLASTHVLDAAVQTINVLHKKSPFNFGISLGDAANNTQYNELRWYIDVIDGAAIIPGSGAHLGSDTIDYQKPYQAAGLDKSIPWYQVIGNHDQSWQGAAAENAKTLAAHTSNTVLDMGVGSLAPADDVVDKTGYYMGVIDGTDPLGAVILSGPEKNFPTPPSVVADQYRHSLATLTSPRRNWMNEFFTTTSNPVGHGFTQANLDNDFSCYSFLPKSNIPIKVIVLDDTATGPGQLSYALGCLDQTRLDWLKKELQAGQDNNQLMIIAAHIPVNPYNSLTDPTQGYFKFFYPNTVPGSTSVVSDSSLIATLQTYPNLIMWIAGHRHMNTVTPQPYAGDPTRSFWEVETASLRDFPQQFRTFDIYRNGDNTISITITNVDPAVSTASPATTSRGNAIAMARISGASASTDTTSHAINAELVVQLTPAMQAIIAKI